MSQASMSSRFPNPLDDAGAAFLKQSIDQMLRWSEDAYIACGSYREALRRSFRYMLTDIEITGDASHDERKRWYKYLVEDLDVINVLAQLFDNRAAYGSTFFSLLTPFRRHLQCPKTGCGHIVSLEKAYYNDMYHFDFKDMRFNAVCPLCGHRGEFNVWDQPSQDANSLIPKFWNPFQCRLLHDEFTNDTSVLWDANRTYGARVRQGGLFHLQRVPLPVLESIREKEWFQFNDSAILHIKEPVLAGLQTEGWGVSSALMNFRQLWYVLTLRRANEALASDYVTPFRVISPGQSGSATPSVAGIGGMPTSQDALASVGGDRFFKETSTMVNRRRKDPASVHVSPYPVNYQVFGAEMNQMAPADLMNQGLEQLLNDAGVFVDFFRGSLSTQAGPMALRLIEATWRHVFNDGNNVLSWIVDRVSKLTGWQSVGVRLTPPSLVDDLNRQSIMLSGAVAGQLSPQTQHRMVKHDYYEELKLKQEAALEEARSQQELQQKMEAEGFGQMIAAGATLEEASGQGDPNAQGGGQAPAQGGGESNQSDAQAQAGAQFATSLSPSTPISPQDMEQHAETLAQQLVQMPDVQRQQELDKIRESHPTLHAVVMQRMEQLRQDIRYQAGAEAGIA